jgi:RNA polymerase sigma-70 factor (ECF subfamily)
VDTNAEEGEEHDMSNARAAVATGVKAKSAPRARRQTAGPARRATDKQAKTTQLSEFAELYDQYFPKVFAYVYGRVQDKEVSLDIVSDVFEKAYIKQKSLRSADSFGSWLFTIARNEVSSHWRKEKPAVKAAQEAAWETEIHRHPRGPEDTLLHKERLSALSEMVKQLPKREQEIIALKFDAELTNREIAHVLSTSEVNVRVTIFRALRKLRERMKTAGNATA